MLPVGSIVLYLIAVASVFGETPPQIDSDLRAVIGAQQDAWNRGDIDAFMNGYARSPKTVFVSGDTVTRGWQTVRNRYKKKYDTREKMGTLRFSGLEIMFSRSGCGRRPWPLAIKAQRRRSARAFHADISPHAGRLAHCA